MRHLGSLIAAMAIAPLAWVLLAVGQARSAAAFAAAENGGGDFTRPLPYLAAAGLLIGLIATLRFSPLGALFTGLVYMSSYALLLVAPGGWVHLLRHTVAVAGHQVDLGMPARTGTTPALGALLLVAVLSVGRWRHRPRSTGWPPDTEAAETRPVGLDGLGLTPPNRTAEPEFVARFASTPEPAFARGFRDTDARDNW